MKSLSIKSRLPLLVGALLALCWQAAERLSLNASLGRRSATPCVRLATLDVKLEL